MTKKLEKAIALHFSKLGRKSSPRKAAAARKNGQKGGRPRNAITTTVEKNARFTTRSIPADQAIS